MQPPFSKDTSGGTRPIRALLLLRQGGDHKELIETLKGVSGVDLRVYYRPENLTLAMLMNGTPPDVVLLHLEVTDPADITLVGDLNNKHIPIVGLVNREHELAALKAMRAGADDVLLEPVDTGEASEVLSRVASVSKPEATVGLGKLIVVMHPSGGAGATTIATNSACTLVTGEGRPSVGLLDFDFQFGNAADLLDLPHSSRIEDILDEPERLDQSMLTGMMARHANGLRVLTAPRMPLPLSALTSETASAIVDISRRCFDYVVVDLPVALETWTDVVLKQATTIYVVCLPTVPAVHRLSQLLALMQQEQLSGLPIQIVLNRHHAVSGTGDITVNQFAKAIHRDVHHLIPNDYKLIALSQNQGQAAVEMKPSSAFSVALKEMLAKDVNHVEARRRGLLSFLFGGV